MEYRAKITEIYQKAKKVETEAAKSFKNQLQMPKIGREISVKMRQDMLDALESGRLRDALTMALQAVADVTQDLAFKERAAELLQTGKMDTAWASLYRIFSKYHKMIETGEAYEMHEGFFGQLLTELGTAGCEIGKNYSELSGAVYGVLELLYDMKNQEK